MVLMMMMVWRLLWCCGVDECALSIIVRFGAKGNMIHYCSGKEREREESRGRVRVKKKIYKK